MSAGVFEPNDKLIGFFISARLPNLTPVTHWSYRLGVHPDYQNKGVGRTLKSVQKQVLIAVGVHNVQWSFDPLESRNAYFNIEKLGCRIVSYCPDLYQTTTRYSQCGTDRLVVSWELNREVPNQQPLTIERLRGVPMATEAALLEHEDRLKISVPYQIEQLIDQDEAAARRCRMETRQLFDWAIQQGYHVDRFGVDVSQGSGYYVIRRNT